MKDFLGEDAEGDNPFSMDDEEDDEQFTHRFKSADEKSQQDARVTLAFKGGADDAEGTLPRRYGASG